MLVLHSPNKGQHEPHKVKPCTPRPFTPAPTDFTLVTSPAVGAPRPFGPRRAPLGFYPLELLAELCEQAEQVAQAGGAREVLQGEGTCLLSNAPCVGVVRAGPLDSLGQQGEERQRVGGLKLVETLEVVQGTKGYEASGHSRGRTAKTPSSRAQLLDLGESLIGRERGSMPPGMGVRYTPRCVPGAQGGACEPSMLMVAGVGGLVGQSFTGWVVDLRYCCAHVILQAHTCVADVRRCSATYVNQVIRVVGHEGHVVHEGLDRGVEEAKARRGGLGGRKVQVSAAPRKTPTQDCNATRGCVVSPDPGPRTTQP